MPTTYSASPVEDTIPAGVRVIVYRAQESGGASPVPLSQTTAHPVTT